MTSHTLPYLPSSRATPNDPGIATTMPSAQRSHPGGYHEGTFLSDDLTHTSASSQVALDLLKAHHRYPSTPHYRHYPPPPHSPRSASCVSPASDSAPSGSQARPASSASGGYSFPAARR